MENYKETLLNAMNNMVDFLPEIITAVLILFLGHWVVKIIKRKVASKIIARSGEALTAEFTSDILGIIIYVIIIVFCLNILGFTMLTSKIIAGAGITAFIIGFALKDIGENFLSGIILVFNRPFRTNDIIEIEGLVGRVLQISLRETVIKSLDGKDLFIPNSDILKKPLHNYTIDDLLRSSFHIRVFNSNDISLVMDLIKSDLLSFNAILKKPEPGVMIDSFDNGIVHLRASYWYSLKGSRNINNRLRSDVMLKVFETLKQNGIGIPDHVQDIKLINSNDK